MLNHKTTTQLVLLLAISMSGVLCSPLCIAQSDATTFKIVLDRGADVGQCFGSLFEVTSDDGAVVIGAGFSNVYNTRNRADRHQLQFFVRPTSGERKFEVEALPRPNQLCGTYLYGRDNVVYSTFGGLKAWDAASRTWRELWRFNPDAKKWSFMQRMFSHPELTDQTIHPYDIENKGHPVSNQWGQRVTSFVTNGPDLFVSTSAKDPCEWNPDQNPFLAPEKWKSYGSVYRLTMPGHLATNLAWTNGPTVLELTLRGSTMTITQDSKPLAQSTLTGPLAEQLRRATKLKLITWSNGVYGQFFGKKLDGSVSTTTK